MKSISVFATTWNTNACLPNRVALEAILCADGGLADDSSFDMFCIGLQEVDNRVRAYIFPDEKLRNYWMGAIELALESTSSPEQYIQLACTQHIGLLLVIYIKKSLVGEISNLFSSSMSFESSLFGSYVNFSNKGCVATRFEIFDSSVCIVNTHLNSPAYYLERENKDCEHITSNLKLGSSPVYGRDYPILEHDLVVWLGDMNYRICLPQEEVRRLVKEEDYGALMSCDQLKMQQEYGRSFSDFVEADIKFPPTYKYEVGRNYFSAESSSRSPAWCDRILYRKKNSLKSHGSGSCENEEVANGVFDIEQLCYTSHAAVVCSDHKPVSTYYKISFHQSEKETVECSSNACASINEVEGNRRKELLSNAIYGRENIDNVLNKKTNGSKKASKKSKRHKAKVSDSSGDDEHLSVTKAKKEAQNRHRIRCRSFPPSTEGKELISTEVLHSITSGDSFLKDCDWENGISPQPLRHSNYGHVFFCLFFKMFTLWSSIPVLTFRLAAGTLVGVFEDFSSKKGSSELDSEPEGKPYSSNKLFSTDEESLQTIIEVFSLSRNYFQVFPQGAHDFFVAPVLSTLFLAFPLLFELTWGFLTGVHHWARVLVLLFLLGPSYNFLTWVLLPIWFAGIFVTLSLFTYRCICQGVYSRYKLFLEVVKHDVFFAECVPTETSGSR